MGSRAYRTLTTGHSQALLNQAVGALHNTGQPSCSQTAGAPESPHTLRTLLAQLHDLSLRNPAQAPGGLGQIWEVPLPHSLGVGGTYPSIRDLGEVGRGSPASRGGKSSHSAGTFPGQVPSPHLLGPDPGESWGTGRDGRARGLETLSPPGPSDTMASVGTLCSLLLFSMLCMDLARAGSSFLSPEHQKVQVKCLPTKPHIQTGVSCSCLATPQPAVCCMTWAVAPALRASACSESTQDALGLTRASRLALPLQV